MTRNAWSFVETSEKVSLPRPTRTFFSLRRQVFCRVNMEEDQKPGVEQRDPLYFGYYSMLQHQVQLTLTNTLQNNGKLIDSKSKTCCRTRCEHQRTDQPCCSMDQNASLTSLSWMLAPALASCHTLQCKQERVKSTRLRRRAWQKRWRN